jgi:tRNA(Ile)-lysidine synthase TilS/MesJ
MLRDGDKVLVCISGSSSSICLIHLLRQFIRARGLHVDLGAVTIGDCVGVDPRALMLYLRDLRVEFIFETSDANTLLKTKLSNIARRKGYNVLAMGNTLDKLADEVLKLMLYKGKLYSSPPAAKTW